MMTLLIIMAAFILFGMGWLIVKQAKNAADPTALLMQSQIDSLREQVSKSLSQNALLLEQQLQSVSQNMQNSSGAINHRLDTAANLYGDLRNTPRHLPQAHAPIQPS